MVKQLKDGVNVSYRIKEESGKDEGNDLWAEDRGIDNAAVINDEEKGSEVDSVVISAQSYGRSQSIHI